MTAQLLQMMLLQQKQLQMFMEHQEAMQREMFEHQARANHHKQKIDPPKFSGRCNKDLELWMFHNEEHFSSYSLERFPVRGFRGPFPRYRRDVLVS